MKVCLFGGTFDPIHIGHLIMAQSVLNEKELGLEQVVFIPAADPPHKKTAKYSSFQHRYNMLKKSLEGRSCFKVSNIENTLNGESYTINTVNYFLSEYDLEKDEIYLLIGEDSLVNFNTWKRPEEISGKVILLTIKRPGWKRDNVEKKFLKKTKFIDGPEIKLSSTLIRDYVKTGKSIKYLVTDSVRDYINKNNLYVN